MPLNEMAPLKFSGYVTNIYIAYIIRKGAQFNFAIGAVSHRYATAFCAIEYPQPLLQCRLVLPLPCIDPS